MGCLSDIDTTLGMYYAAGTSITPGTVSSSPFCCYIFINFSFSKAELNEACKAVTGSSVSSHLVDVLFTIFDENSQF